MVAKNKGRIIHDGSSGTELMSCSTVIDQSDEQGTVSIKNVPVKLDRYKVPFCSIG